MIEVSALEFHFWQFMVLVALGIGYIWGKEVGVKKERYEAEKRMKEKD